jgi:hypothetical protein
VGWAIGQAAVTTNRHRRHDHARAISDLAATTQRLSTLRGRTIAIARSLAVAVDNCDTLRLELRRWHRVCNTNPEHCHHILSSIRTDPVGRSQEEQAPWQIYPRLVFVPFSKRQAEREIILLSQEEEDDNRARQGPPEDKPASPPLACVPTSPQDRTAIAKGIEAGISIWGKADASDSVNGLQGAVHQVWQAIANKGQTSSSKRSAASSTVPPPKPPSSGLATGRDAQTQETLQDPQNSQKLHQVHIYPVKETEAEKSPLSQERSIQRTDQPSNRRHHLPATTGHGTPPRYSDRTTFDEWEHWSPEELTRVTREAEQQGRQTTPAAQTEAPPLKKQRP